MYYLVNRPKLLVIFVSENRDNCRNEMYRLEYQFDHDYEIMDDQEFLRIVVMEHT